LFYKIFDVVNDERKGVHFNHWQHKSKLKYLDK
jgi:hypothetical protein